MSDALERLFNSNANQEQYSLEEQMASAEKNAAEENDDFISDMSEDARRAFFGKGATEITLDTPVEQPNEQPVVQPMNSPIKQFVTQQMEQPQIIPQSEPETFSKPVYSQQTVETPKETFNDVPEEMNVIAPEQPKKRAGRPPKKTVENTNVSQPKLEPKVESKVEPKIESKPQTDIGFNNIFVPMMNQLAKDLIDDLRKNKYKIARFDDTNMEILFNYMYSKF